MSEPSGIPWPGDFRLRPEPLLRRALIISGAAHVLFVALVLFWPGWKAPRIDPSQAFMVSLVSEPGGGGPAPREVKPPEEVAPPEAPPEPEASEADTKVLSEPAEKSAQEKPAPQEAQAHKCPVLQGDRKLAEAIDHIRERMQREAELRAAIAKLQRGRAGNPAARGGEVVGEGFSEGGVPLSFNLYYQEVWGRVRSNWALPSVRQRGLKAVVAVKIARDGTVENIALESGSGDDAFDRSALSAVRASSPLPPLPGDYLGRWHEVGIRFHQ